MSSTIAVRLKDKFVSEAYVAWGDENLPTFEAVIAKPNGCECDDPDDPTLRLSFSEVSEIYLLMLSCKAGLT